MNIEHIDKDGSIHTFTYELVVEEQSEILRVYEEASNRYCGTFAFDLAVKHVLNFLKYKPESIEVIFLDNTTFIITQEYIQYYSDSDLSLDCDLSLDGDLEVSDSIQTLECLHG